MRIIDTWVVALYLLATMALGAWFARRKQDSERFMAAGRSLPGWAVGLSIFGTYVSSISFLANPGKAYSGNWNPFVFSLSLPLAAWVATRWFVPFYRSSGEVSAYHHLERRFGAWARTYAVVCYLLTQLVRSGAIMCLLALALTQLTGWRPSTIILLTGLLMTAFPLVGGTEAVVWVGVVQSVVLALGAITCMALLVFGMPQGPGQLFEVAAAHDKFSLGSFDFGLGASTFWVILLYGVAINLQNFGIDQSYIQRYITARSDEAGRKSVWVGALMYIPLSAVFFFIGTALFVFYSVQPNLLPIATSGDKVFPYFIRNQLPIGMAGLVIAAICAAGTDSTFNSTSTLILRDIYVRYLRPNASEGESMVVLRTSTILFGILATVIAFGFEHATNATAALDVWWKWSGILGGGTLGLFLLGRISRRADGVGAAIGVILATGLSLWMTFSKDWTRLPDHFRSPFHPLLVIVFCTIVILGVGLLFAALRKPRTAPEERILVDTTTSVS